MPTTAAQPIDLLLEPIVKRFRYHFYGHRQTNRRDKPEWFFTFVLNLIGDHTAVLAGPVQQLLIECGHGHIDARIEFISGLVAEVSRKLEQLLARCMREPGLYVHAVSEAVLFDRQLRDVHVYLPDSASCISSLCANAALRDHWIEVERELSTEQLTLMLRSPTAWQRKFAELQDVDLTHAPECAVDFVELMEVLLDRFEAVSDACVRRRFVCGVQAHLLRRFYTDIAAFVRNVHIGRTTRITAVCPRLNGLFYVHQALEDMADRISMVELSALAAPSGTPGDSDAAVAATEKGIFHEELQSYRALMEHTQQLLADAAVMPFKRAISAYQKQSWLLRSDLLPDDTAIAGSSEPPDEPSALLCDALGGLRAQLCEFEALLATDQFAAIWPRVASDISAHLYKDMVSVATFNEAGAQQLSTDVRALCMVVRQWTAQPAAYFKQLHEAAVLLTLPAPDRAELMRLLERAPADAARVRLDLLRIFRLSPQEALAVLQRLKPSRRAP